MPQQPPPLIVFDDDPESLSPMTDLRASFEVRTGALTTLERIEHALGRDAAAVWTSDGLAGLASERLDVAVNELPAGDALLLVSARCALPPEAIGELKVGEALREAGGGELVAAHLARADAERFLKAGGKAGALPRGLKSVEQKERCMLRHPCDVIRLRDAAIAMDLALFADEEQVEGLGPGVAILGDHHVAVDPTAEICPLVTLDAQGGPIVIGPDAVVRPGAVICGPAYIGAGSTIVDRAHIKANTAIGPVCKIGGEVGGTIFQGFSNKAHDGHLGDSWVGEWVNFGAGTTNSNLLNTYGEVMMQSSAKAKRVRTGMTFLGAVVGDHAKFAIGTRLMTGAVIGTGAMVAVSGFAPATVEAFAWWTDAGEKRYRMEKFLIAMEAMMGRRDMDATGRYVERVKGLGDRAG
ncbi:MAG: hypothetical protein EA376_14175 [Phycisphaeraceae bacterium]|nr:MAG: hypothetical protein EA376_14175 [Phycisphaeraceae bacterium]